MSIKEKSKKINLLKNKIIDYVEEKKDVITPEVLTVIIIILVGFSGFGLGRLSMLEERRIPIYIQDNIVTSAVVSQSIENIGSGSYSDGSVVASINGSKYHYPWCSGASRMKEENKIWFSGIEEAQKAGYTPAANCKGLK